MGKEVDVDEVLACFNKEDIPLFHTGKIDSIVFPVRRDKAHLEKIPHIICRIYAMSPDGKYLVQKRAANRPSHPGLFTDSASGHIRYHKPFTYEFITEEAWRELEEEMGTKVISGRLLDIHLEEFKSGGCELAYNFLAIVHPVCNPDPKETSPESGFFTKNELREMLKNKPFVKIVKKYWKKIINANLLEKLLQDVKYDLGLTKSFNESELTPVSSSTSSSTSVSGFVYDVNFQNKNVIHQNINSKNILGNKMNYSNSASITDSNFIIKTSTTIVGAIIGRFQPFHNGHLYVIKKVLENCSKIKIGIGSSQYSKTKDNPFSFEQRKEMIIRTLKFEGISLDKVIILPIPDQHNLNKWINKVLEILEPFDIFYSNSAWTRDLIKKAGKKVGPYMKIEFDKFNGSKIREMFIKGLDISALVPKQVYDYIKSIGGIPKPIN